MQIQHSLRCAAIVAASLCAGPGQCVAATLAWQPESGVIDAVTAHALVDSLIEDVETQALRPRMQAEYDAAKARLLALVGTPAPSLERATIYDAARAMLSTLDTDGHTLLWSKQQASTWDASTHPEAAAQVSAVRTVDAPGGRSVLVIRPPRTTFHDTPSTRVYTEALVAQVNRKLAGPSAPCGLVIDLGEQAGGSAWPVIPALSPLITSDNAARLVDRDGRRRPLIPKGAPEWAFGGTLPTSDLLRFAGRRFAVILTAQTASAGELVAVALRGEPAVRTFGRPTYGLTTANLPTSLPDGATVLLTISRFAYGDGPALRGPLVPDVAAGKAATPDDVLAEAAAWAAQACMK